MANYTNVWTADEDATVRRLYPVRDSAAIAQVIGRSVSAIRNRCMQLGLAHKHRPMSTEEEAIIRAAYASAVGAKEMRLDRLAKRLGRSKTRIVEFARTLGLTNQRRPKTAQPSLKARPMTPEEVKAAGLAGIRKRLATHGHPRGAAGLRHTDAAKLTISRKVRAFAASQTPEQVSARVQKALRTKIAIYGTGSPCLLRGEAAYSRAKRGRRVDLGDTFFRSRWEANYARYLNWRLAQGEITAWAYEPRAFRFEGVTDKPFTYTPDFLVVEANGRAALHEVKGWLDPASQRRLARMATFFPAEVVVVIGPKEYRAIEKRLSDEIAGWEFERPRRVGR